MSKEDIKLSVIVPIYNVDKYLSKCLDSILLQTYKNLEIICVNDGSTDTSLKILKQYAEKDKRIIVIDQENRGLSGARNVGMSIMTGEYFTFMDSDDWIQLGAYQKCMDIIKNEKRPIDILVFNGFLYYQNILYGDPVLFNLFSYDDWGSLKESNFKDYRKRKSPLHNTMAVWNKIFRTDWYKQYNFQFMERMLAQDRLFSAQTYLKAKNIYVLEDYFSCYRKQPESLSYTAKKNIFNLFTICDEVKKVYQQEGFYEEALDSYLQYVLRESLMATRSKNPDLMKDIQECIRTRFKAIISDMGEERYKRNKYHDVVEDYLNLDIEEVKEKHKALMI